LAVGRFRLGCSCYQHISGVAACADWWQARSHGEGILDCDVSLVKDPEARAAYAKASGPAIQAAGGRILVRGMPAQTYDAGVNQRTVVIEFDSVASAIAAHDSPAYQASLKVLGDAVVRDIRIVEGLD
jgi:uncharacterized protein (DUF1330 family)